mmetsp:Transcript_19108/g.53470  ORF Transcript_19108/g.53470 Transcript_19108/m.53470 type:complete len:128 (-) Transcript_19108:424-807(-)|eukprot:CAMPEP_0202351118 /NCGR_PEP_ID=MMETSP1126-20121109/7905_1 /ASSEMBLY_ACC=CAM_ASM_000457 /TAXON_ID=3047 /ORGANISM="Dunaliella tertiolecta, Strain CCMP1320" /LENGTH=127 /DNA_ID=CAMNT_0048943199 /DNA_START=238 /DNA_END=621 /DNA_ORIENTATION=+
MDPREKANKYMETHKLGQLFEVLTAQLLFHKPDNPRKFIVKYLEEVKVSGTQPLLTEADLRTMFGMFDITKRGVMTPEQVNNAQHSILGPGADLQSLGLTVHRPMKEADFVEHMLKTCKAGVPFANS